MRLFVSERGHDSKKVLALGVGTDLPRDDIVVIGDGPRIVVVGGQDGISLTEIDRNRRDPSLSEA